MDQTWSWGGIRHEWPRGGYTPKRARFEDTSSIDLLLLRPGSQHHRICCEILPAARREAPSYEALSYAWGRSDKRLLVYLGSEAIAVRENLWHALHALRPEPGEPSRILWVDALCLDRGADIERFQTVSKIGSVYSNANRVICWLGQRSASSDQAIDFLQDAAHMLPPSLSWSSERTRGGSREHTDALAFYDWVNRNGYHDGWRAVKDLMLGRPYWSRIWIRQELVFAQTIVVQCGDRELAWSIAAPTTLTLRRVYGMVRLRKRGRLLEWDLSFDHLDWILTRRRRLRSDKHPSWLYRQLVSCRSACASDPRDKVYGLHGLLCVNAPADATRLRPNYQLSNRAVCLKAFEYCVFDDYYTPRGPGCLDILCSSGGGGDDGGIDSNFPSWLPDWSKDRPRPLHAFASEGGFLASHGKPPTAMLHSDGRELRCRGLVLGQVRDVGNLMHAAPGAGSELAQLDTLLQWCRMADRSLNIDEGWDRLTTTISLGTLQGASLDSVWNDLLHLTTTPRRSCDDAERIRRTALRFFVFSWLHRRRLAVWTGGSMLLAPDRCRAGDLISIVYGCNTPIVLRKVGRRGVFRVVGDCYLHSIMYGEAIQGHRRWGYSSTRLTLV